MDEPILDAICERRRQKTYINGSRITSQGGVVEKMVFIVRGKFESINGENGIGVSLSEGDACGEELLTWYLEHSSVSKGKPVIDTITCPKISLWLRITSWSMFSSTLRGNEINSESIELIMPCIRCFLVELILSSILIPS
jgi:hypothetical protein